MESQTLTTVQKSHSDPTSSKKELCNEWLSRFAINAGVALDAGTRAVYLKTWLEGFADVEYGRLKAAFIACLRAHAYPRIPTIADVRQHLKRAESNGAEEEASLKFQQVRDSIRLHYNPDIPWRGPKISERTRRAINAAGGMAYLSECLKENLVFARKRFIESWLRWDELKQDQYLLPEGEFKNLLADVAAMKALPAPQRRVVPEAERQEFSAEEMTELMEGAQR